ncbi:MAG TPA: ABC transporter permease [Anaerolineaceae bacterium]|nr:ABC transporter permease [Anaerolineaceae bacterium]
MDLDFILDVLGTGLRMATPFILAGLGGLVSLSAGDLNISLEGFMLVGAFFAVLGSYFFESYVVGICFAVLATLLYGLLFGLFTIKLKADVFVVGIALNLLASEVTVFFSRLFFNVRGSFSDPRIEGIPNIHLAFLDKVPVLNDLLNNHSAFVYVSWVMIVVFWFLIYRTPYGFYFRAAGEHPEALETTGIRVNKIRWIANMICSVMCGLAGAHLSLGYLRLFVEDMTAGRGFIALSAVIFGGSNPVTMAITSLLFGLAEGISLRIQNMGIPSQFTLMLPYLTTILALVIRAVRKSRKTALIASIAAAEQKIEGGTE